MAEVARSRHEAQAVQPQHLIGSRNQNSRATTSANSAPSDQFANTAIDQGFELWSSTWMVDSYIPNSAQVIDKGFKDRAYIVLGNFSFARNGAAHTIPFAAEFALLSNSYKLVKLCYNDLTSGMTDCIDPSPEVVAQARSRKNLLSMVLAVGVSAAILHSVSEDLSNEDTQYDQQNEANASIQQFRQYDLKRRQEKARDENDSRDHYDKEHDTHTPHVPIPID